MATDIQTRAGMDVNCNKNYVQLALFSPPHVCLNIADTNSHKTLRRMRSAKVIPPAFLEENILHDGSHLQKGVVSSQ